MHAVTPSMPPHVCPRQDRQRPTPKIYAAGEVIDFALMTVYGLLKSPVCPRWRHTPSFVPQRLELHCTDKAGNIYSVPLHIY
jgi:hypothetical protein